MNINWISIYRWEDAPEQYRELSGHGGDEDWVAVVPESMAQEYMPFLEEGRFGNDVTEHKIPGAVVYISAHA